ncbi:MAG: lipoyl synthase [Candidatus Nanopelagicales bacterium]|nr:lipoyl synthase [Candidatus Nanopelagicales bacterium]MDZ4250856.1 lipoyl synthase [Candidatus Nanopelagicales bacterium]
MATSDLPLRRIERHNAETPIERKPEWIKTKLSTGPTYLEIQELVRHDSLHTVCQEARCPNIFECWEDREATFLVGGSRCTRRCDFCQIDTGRPDALDLAEPERVAAAVLKMGLEYATVTGVARDDLPDQGAWLYSETVRQIHSAVPNVGVEVLIPDFSGKSDLLDEVIDAGPQVLAHNVETVPRLMREVRPAFSFERSLSVITHAKGLGAITKSNLILGLGETDEDVVATILDLRAAGCDLLTITQYLRPSARHHPVARWVPPEDFEAWRAFALSAGFRGVMSGPLVRSSYRAGRLYRSAVTYPGDHATSP